MKGETVSRPQPAEIKQTKHGFELSLWKHLPGGGEVLRLEGVYGSVREAEAALAKIRTQR